MGTEDSYIVHEHSAEETTPLTKNILGQMRQWRLLLSALRPKLAHITKRGDDCTANKTTSLVVENETCCVRSLGALQVASPVPIGKFERRELFRYKCTLVPSPEFLILFESNEGRQSFSHGLAVITSTMF